MITQFTEVIESNNFLSKDMNTFISEDDIYCNFDKFEHGKTHVCFVTGVSGSGKSTLSKKLARKYNANYIELDIVMYALDKMRERAGGKDKARQRLREEHPWIYEWIMNTHQDEETWPKLTSEKMSTYDFHIKKTMELIDWLRQTTGWSSGKPPRFIIDGVDLVNIIPMRLEYTEYPFIFKGTSKLKSALRRAQREGGLKNYYSDVKGIIELIKAVYGEYYWSTSMQADQTAGRYMTINRDSSNAKEVDEDSLTAKKMGIVFSDDDIHYNVHRFLNKEVPVLWITGMSGGGKSTLAGEMADKAPGVISLLSIDNLDDFVGIYVIEHDMKTINKWRKDKVYDIIYKFIKANEKLATDAFNDTHNKEWQDFVTTVLKYVVKFYTPKKQIIIEGVQIPYVYYRAPELFGSDSAIIIKGTSVFTSLIRRYHRDQDRGWFINKFSDIKKYFDMYSMWYRTQNDFRNYVTPNMESWAEEKEIIQSMDPKDQEYAKGSRANIKHHHIHKEDGKPVGFLDLMEDTNNNSQNVYMFIGIDPKYRGKGIFQKLVHNACEWLDGNTNKYKAIMYYIDKNNTASIKAISKVKEEVQNKYIPIPKILPDLLITSTFDTSTSLITLQISLNTNIPDSLL